ncbi:hypothetical protein CYR55_04620 [Chimaeribacter californicus]|uniref:Uncharacterized protein n=1 Tax=Chimaeribacter californicus TaxID=2060067 RepID=A0A2N5EF84_9GAMM|nr:hypothetical protein CYR55_04620 [Chimaeribacter californicus]
MGEFKEAATGVTAGLKVIMRFHLRQCVPWRENQREIFWRECSFNVTTLIESKHRYLLILAVCKVKRKYYAASEKKHPT